MAKIIITGASSGIGAEIAKAFYRDGSHQIIVLGRSRKRLDAIAKSTTATPLICDITDENGVKRICSEILETFKSAPDVLVNNAGHFESTPFLTMTADLFREQIDSNLIGSFLMTHQLLPSMIKAGAGHVFFMGSVASVYGYAGVTAYCAAKHGLLGFARAVRAETLETGVRVTTILPGATLTPSWDGTALPEDRFMPAEDVARCVLEAWKLSPQTVIEEVLLRPRGGDI